MTKQYRYFSADSHFECPPDMWTHRVPEAYRERAPRRVKLPNGNDIIVEEGRPITFRGTNQFAGKSFGNIFPGGTGFRPRCRRGASATTVERAGRGRH